MGKVGIRLWLFGLVLWVLMKNICNEVAFLLWIMLGCVKNVLLSCNLLEVINQVVCSVSMYLYLFFLLHFRLKVVFGHLNLLLYVCYNFQA